MIATGTPEQVAQVAVEVPLTAMSAAARDDNPRWRRGSKYAGSAPWRGAPRHVIGAGCCRRADPIWWR